MDEENPVGIVELIHPLAYGEILMCAVMDYFGDSRYTPDSMLYEVIVTGNTEETQGRSMIIPTSDSKIYIMHEYNPKDEAYPLILVNPVSEDDREASFGQYLGKTETATTLKKKYGKVKNVLVRFVVVSLNSPIVAGKITSHLRTGLSSVIMDALAERNIVAKDTSPKMTAADQSYDEWRGKILRFLYTFDMSFRVFWTTERDADLEYLYDYEGINYRILYARVHTPIGDGTLDEAEEEKSRVQIWDEDNFTWIDISTTLKSTIWDKFKEDFDAEALEPDYVGEFVAPATEDI